MTWAFGTHPNPFACRVPPLYILSNLLYNPSVSGLNLKKNRPLFCVWLWRIKNRRLSTALSNMGGHFNAPYTFFYCVRAFPSVRASLLGVYCLCPLLVLSSSSSSSPREQISAQQLSSQAQKSRLHRAAGKLRGSCAAGGEHPAGQNLG